MSYSVFNITQTPPQIALAGPGKPYTFNTRAEADASAEWLNDYAKKASNAGEDFKNIYAVNPGELPTWKEQVEWMAIWAARNNLKLELTGECGFGRECVGVTYNQNYPDYEWHNEDFTESFGGDGVWTPPDAYHKHPCVAVLGRGEAAERQLYQWLKWFDDNGYKFETGDNPAPKGGFDPIYIMMGKQHYYRMVKK